MTFEQSPKGGREIAMQVSSRAFQTKGTASSLLESSEGSEAGRLARRLLQDNHGHKSPESVGMERPGKQNCQDLAPACMWEVYSSFGHIILKSPLQGDSLCMPPQRQVVKMLSTFYPGCSRLLNIPMISLPTILNSTSSSVTFPLDHQVSTLMPTIKSC